MPKNISSQYFIYLFRGFEWLIKPRLKHLIIITLTISIIFLFLLLLLAVRLI